MDLETVDSLLTALGNAKETDKAGVPRKLGFKLAHVREIGFAKLQVDEPQMPLKQKIFDRVTRKVVEVPMTAQVFDQTKVVSVSAALMRKELEGLKEELEGLKEELESKIDE